MTSTEESDRVIKSVFTIPGVFFPVVHSRSPPYICSGVQDAWLTGIMSTLDLYQCILVNSLIHNKSTYTLTISSGVMSLKQKCVHFIPDLNVSQTTPIISL